MSMEDYFDRLDDEAARRRECAKRGTPGSRWVCESEETKVGRIHLGVFDQGEYWRTKDGRLLHIALMADEHIDNLIAFLDRGAKMFGRRWALYTQIAGDSLLSVEHPSDGVFAAQSHLESRIMQAELEPLLWLHGTELYRALVAQEKWRAKKQRKAHKKVYKPRRTL